MSDLEILLFPSDEFGGQELPSSEIAPFLQGFKLTKDLPLEGDGCRLMEKVSVNGRKVYGRRASSPEVNRLHSLI